ncbi:hypothetical protein BX616_010683 [Lobosporangium transversale]|uniref:Large ribosomal subunit protein uL30m n=1 Tax=Lobosporangium transversale TaxID=64571 RepID=A0A1Y2G615_9FUNG|nr:hypothetical protein BCR41DRAFT_390663 [Lobosporangium transversale]KAF9917986.1 hypothetical protein BX616_010683 [Lobosporangium transversale]ORY97037.1 hypothetical protein BCR41DRAFT_390663 [Lobosporangium transversale]|eukprot:XP_021875583.1 hypothetical protein BCR41DRAFT_390663 [Lobosporangium transversale]
MSSVSRIISTLRCNITFPVRAYSTSVATTESVPAATTGHYKVTQTRSTIGVPKSTIKVLKSLGLGRRIGRPVFQPHEPSAAGKILKVKELVKVENVPGPIPAEGYKRTRANNGYKVIGKML